MNAHTTKHQHGSVLIVGLLLLMVLTLLGVTAMSNMTMEERMASAYQKMDLAFESGETALDDTFRAIAANPAANGLIVSSCQEDVYRATRSFESNFTEHTPGIEIASTLSTNNRGTSRDIKDDPGNDLGTEDGMRPQKVDIIADTTVTAAGRVAARSVQVQTVKIRAGSLAECNASTPE